MKNDNKLIERKEKKIHVKHTLKFKFKEKIYFA